MSKAKLVLALPWREIALLRTISLSQMSRVQARLNTLPWREIALLRTILNQPPAKRFPSVLPVAVITLCFAKIGGGSAKKMKIKGFSFCFALALHYLCTRYRKMRGKISFCPTNRSLRQSPCIPTALRPGHIHKLSLLWARGFRLTNTFLHGAFTPLSFHSFRHFISLLYS